MRFPGMARSRHTRVWLVGSCSGCRSSCNSFLGGNRLVLKGPGCQCALVALARCFGADQCWTGGLPNISCLNTSFPQSHCLPPLHPTNLPWPRITPALPPWPWPTLLANTSCACVCLLLRLQTKIFEVLQLKKEMSAKLWVSDECTVLDAVKKVNTSAGCGGWVYSTQ